MVFLHVRPYHNIDILFFIRPLLFCTISFSLFIHLFLQLPTFDYTPFFLNIFFIWWYPKERKVGISSISSSSNFSSIIFEIKSFIFYSVHFGNIFRFRSSDLYLCRVLRL
eukprot:UN00961